MRDQTYLFIKLLISILNNLLFSFPSLPLSKLDTLIHSLIPYFPILRFVPHLPECIKRHRWDWMTHPGFPRLDRFFFFFFFWPPKDWTLLDWAKISPFLATCVHGTISAAILITWLGGVVRDDISYYRVGLKPAIIAIIMFYSLSIHEGQPTIEKTHQSLTAQ